MQLKNKPKKFTSFGISLNLRCQFCILVILFFSTIHQATGVETLTLAWDQNTESNIVGYKIHYGTNSGNYSTTIDVHGANTITLTNLDEGMNYYAAVTAYNTIGLESTYSNEVMFTTTSHPSPEIELTPIFSDDGGKSIMIRVHGEEGQTFTVESSVDLKTWVEFGTLTINNSNNFLIDDNVGEAIFYRALFTSESK